MKFRHRNFATALALTTGAGGALTLAGMPANAADAMVDAGTSWLLGAELTFGHLARR